MRRVLLLYVSLAVFTGACGKGVKSEQERTQKSRTPRSSIMDHTTRNAPVKSSPADRCLYELKISKHTSYFREQGVQLRDFQEKFLAAPPTKESLPVKVSSGWKLAGEPLFFIDPVAKKAFVNRAAFSDLKRVDVPGLRKDAVMGRVLPALLAVLKKEEIIRFLVVSQMIQTYYHISADLCALEQSELQGAVSVRFKGTHLFFTNRRNVEKIQFTVTISSDGLITVGR